MSLVGKPRPGVCGHCGCAVVRSAKPPPKATDVRREVNGHEYQVGRLVRVRCKAHGGLGFEGEPHDCFGMPSASGTVYGTE